ncbi:type II toxin-antitoxin system HicA family toxin [Lichenibacterium dinghuense]|uniref:type II toxin-antitoxin system HicA family toxin n=1 Tax=Lichenibacterium dinghuense TaxID=2895977 RepID=UPI001F1FDF1E|nr:type II toxin-antitoxin system HicA family toxin [Lichenibacterium sp. 6Y81]
MPMVETNARRILDRLAAEGWRTDGGSKHAKLSHPNRPGIVILVPRHREIAPGTARAIARAAGWI